MKKYTFLIAILTIVFTSNIFAQEAAEKIKWLDFEEAVKLSKKEPKKIFIDMYTDWCGWCKKMDQSTFIDPVIVKYMNENYYAVKFDAERSDPVEFNGKEYKNPNPDGKRSSHELAAALMQGRMSYPSFVFMGEDFSVLTIVPGFQKSASFEPILHYMATDQYKKQGWEEYSSEFQGSFE